MFEEVNVREYEYDLTNTVIAVKKIATSHGQLKLIYCAACSVLKAWLDFKTAPESKLQHDNLLQPDTSSLSGFHPKFLKFPLQVASVNGILCVYWGHRPSSELH